MQADKPTPEEWTVGRTPQSFWSDVTVATRVTSLMARTF